MAADQDTQSPGGSSPAEPVVLSTIKARGSPSSDNIGSPEGVRSGLKLEQTRANIAYGLLAILLLVVLFQVISSAALSSGCWVWGSYCPQAEKALSMITSTTQSIFTAMVGLVGSVVGFYFGSKSGRSPGD